LVKALQVVADLARAEMVVLPERTGKSARLTANCSTFKVSTLREESPVCQLIMTKAEQNRLVRWR
jgi:hypothetical protein